MKNKIEQLSKSEKYKLSKALQERKKIFIKNIESMIKQAYKSNDETIIQEMLPHVKRLEEIKKHDK